MRKLSVALWGCGRMGRATGELLSGIGHAIPWFRDVNNASSAILARDLGQGQVLHMVPDPESHPLVDLIIDASGDKTLLSYWRTLLDAQRARYVFLTRREPAAEHNIMMGMPEPLRVPPPSSIIALGSCTGNALVPLMSHLYKDFSLRHVSARVLHPLKQRAIMELRSIDTALELSVRDNNPSLADITVAQSMELPVDRGMALDVAVTFDTPPSKDELMGWFLKVSERYPFIQCSTAHESSASIVGSRASAVVDGGWRLMGQNLRMLLWQDNEMGVSARIADLLEVITWQTTQPTS